MPSTRLEKVLLDALDGLARTGRLKGAESVIRGVVPARDGNGPRYLLEGEGERPFLRLNANNYLGMALHAKVRAAEEEAVECYGTGPGAVRFISGTWAPHTVLERRLADFHGRADAMLFSSAYAAVMGVLPQLITARTTVLSDALNHNSIINAIALARPAEKRIFPHLDLAALERHLTEAARSSLRAIVITDGVFSMRGDHAPLERMRTLVDAADAAFPENAFLIVDDSHGVGAFGPTGRGTEEITLRGAADVLIATLGKALGVNGGYATASGTIIRYLRETSPFYVYSNPITPGEAAAALAAVATVDSTEGRQLLTHLQAMASRFRKGLGELGLETLPGDHPIVPLMVRDGARTARIVAALRREGILVTALSYPVVPQGEEEIRFQISADHTPADIDAVLHALARGVR